MTDPLVIGCDPASTRLAFVAKHPLLGTYSSAKYVLGKKFGPDCCAEAMDVTLDFLDAVATMATSRTPKVGYLEAPTTGFGGRMNVQSSFKQCFISGAVQACMIKAGYDVHLVPPATWKKVVVGNGSANKDDVARHVAGRWPKLATVFSGDRDLADAACIWAYGDAIYRRGQRLASPGGL